METHDDQLQSAQTRERWHEWKVQDYMYVSLYAHVFDVIRTRRHRLCLASLLCSCHKVALLLCLCATMNPSYSPEFHW